MAIGSILAVGMAGHLSQNRLDRYRATRHNRWIDRLGGCYKLGNISPEIQARVNSLTLDRVESLSEDLLDSTQMADLNSWLDSDTNVKID